MRARKKDLHDSGSKAKHGKIEGSVGVTKQSTPYMVPDRATGLEEFEELRLRCPGRPWNFVRTFYLILFFIGSLSSIDQVEVDVPYDVRKRP